MKTRELVKAITAVLAAVDATTGPLTTERQFLREVVSVFGNTGAIGNLLASVPGLQPDPDMIGSVHRTLRADLQALVDDQLGASDRKRIYAQADKMVLVPRTAEDGALRHHYLPLNLEAAIAHAMRLLIDPTRPEHRKDLKQCQWRDCNKFEDARQLPHVRRFFFVSERREAAEAAGKSGTGKLPDRYCCEEHMRAAHRLRATEATIRRRKVLRDLKLKAAAKRASKHR